MNTSVIINDQQIDMFAINDISFRLLSPNLYAFKVVIANKLFTNLFRDMPTCYLLARRKGELLVIYSGMWSGGKWASCV